MIRVIMADKNNDMPVLFQFRGRQALFLRQFLILAQPVVKNQDGIVARDGKTAVIIMRNKIIQQNAFFLQSVLSCTGC